MMNVISQIVLSLGHIAATAVAALVIYIAIASFCGSNTHD